MLLYSISLNRIEIKVTAYLLSDAQEPVRNELTLHDTGRRLPNQRDKPKRLKEEVMKSEQENQYVKDWSFNIGTMNGKSAELVNFMQRTRI